MPLYSIQPNKPYPTKSPFLDYTDDEKRIIWEKVLNNYKNKIVFRLPLPAIWVSMSIFLALSDSLEYKLINFKGRNDNKLGTFYGATVYLSSDLLEGEYYIGIEEEEIKDYKRRLKLNKLCGRITEEKQK